MSRGQAPSPQARRDYNLPPRRGQIRERIFEDIRNSISSMASGPAGGAGRLFSNEEAGFLTYLLQLIRLFLYIVNICKSSKPSSSSLIFVYFKHNKFISMNSLSSDLVVGTCIYQMFGFLSRN
ncbi:hypothetical protein J5N97_013669 [Dioscorea zingiberensis]|uniref:Uncharacterized protein n=1 Tax=Dioscorea zingiberensis TaxID=325984 RepID=A0A9D5HIU8_9LILI|nr:hypothetical protein J5N97_013669 [Dioscorea zingiberensis]